MLVALVVLAALGGAAAGGWLATSSPGRAVHEVASRRTRQVARNAPRRGESRRGESRPATAPGPDGVTAAWVVAENRKPGTTSWRIVGTPPGTIAGFAGTVAADRGEEVTLYVTTNAASFHVDAYRMGWYGGDDARLVWTSPTVAGRQQPACPVAPVTHMVSCDNWSPSLRFRVTAAFVQGDYLLELYGSGGQRSYVPLTVTDPSSHATYLVKNDVYTWQAWNSYGGYDFYSGEGTCAPSYPPCNRATVVSFDRPYDYGDGAADFLGEELPLVEYMERHGLDVTYTTDVTVEQDPAALLQHKAILSLGHDECWSLDERLDVQAAADHGVNVVFFGASAILRHVRMQASPLGPDREEVDYRDSAEDPLDGRASPLLVTGNWWGSPPTDWAGDSFVGEGYSGFLEPGAAPVPLVVVDASAWIFEGMEVQDGTAIPGVLLSDFDQVDPDDHPADLQVLAQSPIPASDSESQDSPAYSDMTYYTEPASEAGVFDTGTVMWIPDLATVPAVDEMTGNLLRLFGQGPAGRTEPSVANWSQFAS